MDGFEYLRSLSPGEWDERIVYLYRQDPSIAKSDDRNRKYISKISMPFDEEWVQQKFGGGRFLAIVKNQRSGSGDAERKFSFEIEGPARLQPDEKFRDQPGAPAATNPGPTDQSALIRDLTREVISVARESRERGDPEEDAVARVAETMQRGAEAAMDMMKHAAQSATGSPMADKILEAALTRLNGGPAADPLASLAGAVALFKQLGVGAGAAAQNPIAVLKDLKEGLGIDIAGALRGGKEDWRATLAGMVPSLFEGAIGILDRYSALQRQNFEISLATHRERNASRQAAAAGAPIAPAADAAPPVAPAPMPASVLPAPLAASAAVGAPAPPEFDFEKIRRLIVRHFQNGKAGDFVADLLVEIYPDHLPVFRSLLSDASQLGAMAKDDPILAEIAGDEEFPEFLGELVRALAPEGVSAAGA